MRDRALIGLMLYTVARIGSAARMLVRDYYEESGFWICRLHEKAGKFHQVPANHVLEGYMPEYLDTSEIWGGGEKAFPLFRFMPHKQMSSIRRLERDALAMIKRRAKEAGLPDWIGNHVCRATGITRFLEAGATLEEAANLANHADMRTTRVYDNRDRVIRRASVKRIAHESSIVVSARMRNNVRSAAFCIQKTTLYPVEFRSLCIYCYFCWHPREDALET